MHPEGQEDEEDDVVDPMQFLANEGDGYNENEDNMAMYADGDEPGENGSPPILTSLGLTHINHVCDFKRKF